MANHKTKFGLDAFESTHNALFAKHPDVNGTAASTSGSKRDGLLATFNGNSCMKGEPAGGHLQDFLDFSTFSNENTNIGGVLSMTSSSRATNNMGYLFTNEKGNTATIPLREANMPSVLNKMESHGENTSAFSKTTKPSTGSLACVKTSSKTLTTNVTEMNTANATRSADGLNKYEKELDRTKNGKQTESKSTCAGTFLKDGPGITEANQSRVPLQSHVSQESASTKRNIAMSRLQIDTSVPLCLERIPSYDSSTSSPADGETAELRERRRGSASPLAEYTPVQPNRQQESISASSRTLGFVQSGMSVGHTKENVDPKSVDANANVGTCFATPGFRLSTRKPTRRLGLGPPKRAPLSIEEGGDVEPSPLVTAQMRAGGYGLHARPTFPTAFSATSSIPMTNSTTPPANLALKTPRSDPVPSASTTERLREQKLAHCSLRCESESPSGRFDESARNGITDESVSALKGRMSRDNLDNTKRDQDAGKRSLAEPTSPLAVSETGNCEKIEQHQGDRQPEQAERTAEDLSRLEPKFPSSAALKVTEGRNESAPMKGQTHGGTMSTSAATLRPQAQRQTSIQPQSQPQPRPPVQTHVEPAAPVPARNIALIATTLTDPTPAPALNPSTSTSAAAVFHPQLSDHPNSQQPGTFNTKPPPMVSTKSAIHVNNRPFNRLEVIGRGGSSKVYKVMAPNNRIFALKRVSFDKADAAAIAGYINEINLLKRLATNERIIRLYDAEVNHERGMLLMVMECGEIDLAHVLQKQQGKPVSLNFVRLYWEQMLQAVQAIHEAKIVHSDLKPANFLFVEGSLKLIDFGIAKSIPNDTTNVLLDQQVGTVNYMSPEAILDTNAAMSAGGFVLGGRKCMKMGRPSDVWSLGCILYQMVYARTPFAHLTMYQKLQCIPDPSYPVAYPTAIPAPSAPSATTNVESKRAIDVAGQGPPTANTVGVDPDAIKCMRQCLERDGKQRITIPELLVHRFLKPEEAGKGMAGFSEDGKGGRNQGDGIFVDRRRLEELVRTVGGWAVGDVPLFSKKHPAEEVQRVMEILHGQLRDGKELHIT